VDALVATALVVTVAAGTAHLLLWGRRATWAAAGKSKAVALAAEKLERLRGLAWETDASGTPISDEVTDLSAEPPGSGGTGLRPSPAGTLRSDTPGFVDYVDADGRWRGTGTRPTAGAVYVRRWSVEAFAPDNSNTLVLTVLVLPLVDAAGSTGNPGRGVRLTTIRTRAAR
jgi:hypothetical protein